MKQFFSFNRRDIIGLVGWFIVGLLVGVFALPLMVGREIYQYKRYHLARFEWEDVVRYGIVILLSVALRYSIVGVSAYRLLF